MEKEDKLTKSLVETIAPIITKQLAQAMLNKIEETRPDKTKTAKEQANEEQLKCIENLESVANS